MKKEWVIFKKWMIGTGYHTQSIIEDLEKAEKSIKFSEESSRTIHELGNIALHELGTAIQNRSLPILLEAHTRGIDILLLEHLSST